MIQGKGTDSDEASLPTSAFPETMLELRARHGGSELDAVAFSRRLSRCDIADCAGQCCTEGTSLGDEEVEVLTRLVRLERSFFEAHGVQDPEGQIQSSGRAGAGGRTLVRERLDSEVAADFPVRFGHAACSFLVEGGRCSFQLLSIERGRPAWWWKPVRCWLHPVSLRRGAIGLSEQEGSGGEEFVNPAVTRCSRVSPGGAPASEVLVSELHWLGRALKRDLNSELTVARSGTPDNSGTPEPSGLPGDPEVSPGQAGSGADV